MATLFNFPEKKLTIFLILFLPFLEEIFLKQNKLREKNT